MTILYSDNLELINANIGLGVGLTALLPVLPQLDLMLFGSLGLGPLQADLGVQLQAALGVGIEWNPILSAQAMADVMAGIAAGNILPQLAINANAELAADISVKLGAVNLMLDGALSLRLPIINATAALQAAVGFNVAYVVHQGTSADFGSSVAGELQSELGVGSGDTMYSVTIAVATAADFNVLAGLFLVP